MLLFRASLRRIPGSHAFRCGALGAEVGCPAVACIVASGASGEFGPTLVKFLIRRGDKVAALGSPRSAERLRGLQAELGTNSLAIAMDATSLAEWKSALERIEQTLGPPSGAALLAGGWEGGRPFHESDDAIWQRMFAVNLETARRSLQALLPAMIQRGAGSIVLMGSQVVERPWKGAGAAAYTAAKSAVVALARAVAAEVSSKGIRVNAVMPSVIDTAANRAAMPRQTRSDGFRVSLWPKRSDFCSPTRQRTSQAPRFQFTANPADPVGEELD